MFSLKGLEDYYPLIIPSLQITDSHNKLPLNLQRSNIEGEVKYDFEPELATAMFTDLICQLMTINIKESKGIIDIDDFYFTANGFALKSQYSHDQLRGKQIINIGAIDDKIFNFKEWIQIFDLFPDVLFHFSEESFGTVVGVSDDNDKNGLRIALSIFLSRKPHIAIINPTGYEKTLINEAAEHLNEEKDYKYNDSFIFSSDSKYRSVLEKLIPMVEKLECFERPLSITYIIIEDIEEGTKIDMFHDVFDKYYNGDSIIPYDIAEREKKFSLIHQEYKKEIEEYKSWYKDFFNIPELSNIFQQLRQRREKS